jgi:hypothetical protein
MFVHSVFKSFFVYLQIIILLAFDGWTSNMHQSIWNFIVMTPSRKEYLFQLLDLSEFSHTAEYLASVIEQIIKKIGADRISAIVSDNASNVKNARKLIQEKFPRIENVRCVAHSINLIACDIVKESFGDKLLRRINILVTFFKSSHQANSKLVQLINEKSISGGRPKLYCKTRWTTASESVNSIINLEPVLEEIATNHKNLLTNDKIERIILSRNFFSDLRVLSFVLDPLKKAVLLLESRTATLADCFLTLVRLAAVLNKLPKTFNPNFRNHCVKVINSRFEEFDDDNYLTCFFLDPRFKGAPLKKKVTDRRILRCVGSIGQRLGFDLYEIETLFDQLEKYRKGAYPFDLELIVAKNNPMRWWKLIETDPEPNVLSKVAIHLLSICPNSATCERGFSTLGWLYERRLKLKLENLESMCKLITYWKSNFRTELGYYSINQRQNMRLSDDEINIRLAEAFSKTDEEEHEDISSTQKTTSGEPIPKDNCYVLIEPVWIDKFVDLSHNLIIKDIEIPKEIMDDLDNDDDDDGGVGDGNIGDDGKNGKGVFDYNIDDFLIDDDDGDDENNEE